MRARRSNGVLSHVLEKQVVLRSDGSTTINGRKLEGFGLDELRQSLDKVLEEMADDPMFLLLQKDRCKVDMT